MQMELFNMALILVQKQSLLVDKIAKEIDLK